MSNLAQQMQSQMGVPNAMFNKELKGNPSWGELVLMEDQARNRIADTANFVRDITQIVYEEGVGNAEYKALMNGVLRDLQTFADTLNLLVAKRAGRTRPTNGPEDYTEYFSIGIELTGLTEEMQIVLAPTLLELTEFQHVAHEKVRARHAAEVAAEAATDPTVVSDVEAKPAVEEPKNSTEA